VVCASIGLAMSGLRPRRVGSARESSIGLGIPYGLKRRNVVRLARTVVAVGPTLDLVGVAMDVVVFAKVDVWGRIRASALRARPSGNGEAVSERKIGGWE